MISPEQLIFFLQKENLRLQEELEEAQKDIQDFELLAVEWKKGYHKIEKDLSIKLTNAEQRIEELEKELRAWRTLQG